MDRILPSRENDQYLDKQNAYGNVLDCQQNVMNVQVFSPLYYSIISTLFFVNRFGGISPQSLRQNEKYVTVQRRATHLLRGYGPKHLAATKILLRNNGINAITNITKRKDRKGILI